MLPLSGIIKISDISKELNGVITGYNHLGDTQVRSLLNVPTGVVNLSNGYGKYFQQQTVFSTPGNFSFVVPPGVTTLTVSYPTTSGIASTNISVSPGSTYTGTIGALGAASTFSSVTTPAFDVPIVSWSGGIDDQFGIDFGITSQYYNVYLSTLRGGSGTYTYSNVLSSSVLTGSNVTAYYSAYSGRNWYNSRIDQQPNASNGYITKCYMYDSDRSSAGYSFTLSIKQSVPITISWGSISQYNVVIGTNTANFDIKSYLLTYTNWNTSRTNCNIDVIINSGVVVYGTPGNYAFNSSSSWPAGTTIRLFNYGTIIGYGGTGGNSNWTDLTLPNGNTPGSNGGPATYFQTPITVYNYGIISGGGGGGGAGGSVITADNYNYNNLEVAASGSGGGGGAGFGSGGSGFTSNIWNYTMYAPGNPGSSGGNYSVGGAGGAATHTAFIEAYGAYEYQIYGGAGGAGGSFANAGAGGGAGSFQNIKNNPYANRYSLNMMTTPSSGGAGGNAVVGNGNVSWAVLGTIYGARV